MPCLPILRLRMIIVTIQKRLNSYKLTLKKGVNSYKNFWNSSEVILKALLIVFLHMKPQGEIFQVID